MRGLGNDFQSKKLAIHPPYIFIHANLSRFYGMQTEEIINLIVVGFCLTVIRRII